MSWRANLWLAASLGVVCMGVAITMAAFGFWMIIPFAGAEILFVVACLYWTLRKLSRKEVITVQPDVICLEWGYKVPDRTVQLPRQWSRLQYKGSESLFEVGELCLTAHGKRYALGLSLGREEKKSLHSALKELLR